MADLETEFTGEPVKLVPCEPGALTPDELRTLFLFEKLTDEQLAWIAAHGCTMHMPAGGVVIREGDPAEQFFVLLSGTIALSRKVGQDEVETSRTEQRGVYMGATQSYLRDDGVPRNYMASMRALDDADFFVLSASDFSHMMREWFPMAIHLLEGLTMGMRSTAAAISERQRYEILLGGEVAGVLHYRRHGDKVELRHTEIEQSFSGQGLASRLAAAALDDARSRATPVVVSCPFVIGYLERHPEYSDLLSDGV